MPTTPLAGLAEGEFEQLILSGLDQSARQVYNRTDPEDLRAVIAWLRHAASCLRSAEDLQRPDVWPGTSVSPQAAGLTAARNLALSLYLAPDQPTLAARCLEQAATLLGSHLLPKRRRRSGLNTFASQPRPWPPVFAAPEGPLAAARLAGLLLCTPRPPTGVLEQHLHTLLPNGVDCLTPEQTVQGRAVLLRYGTTSAVDQLLYLVLWSLINSEPADPAEVCALLLVAYGLRDQGHAA